MYASVSVANVLANRTAHSHLTTNMSASEGQLTYFPDHRHNSLAYYHQFKHYSSIARYAFQVAQRYIQN